MDKFIIIDASAVLHRAWHALAKLKNSKGQTINAAYGFTSLILRICLAIDYIPQLFF